MRPKAPLDRDFLAIARTRCWPMRSIGQLMIVVALSGLVMWAVSRGVRRSASGSRNIMRIPATVAQPSDRFVIVAPPEADSAMVIRADPHIDPEMVFHDGPDGRLLRAPDEAEPPSAGLQPQVIPQPR